jgi:hypothetical protein
VNNKKWPRSRSSASMRRDFLANNDDKEKAASSYSVVERGCKESPHVCERQAFRGSGG